MATLTPLSTFGVLKFAGPEAKTYLQGQITSDISKLTEDAVQFTCQCDSKGKVISSFYLLAQDDAYLLIGFTQSLQASLAAFKKFAVFAKVDITDISDDVTLYGFDGDGATRLDNDAIAAQLPTEKMQLTRIADKLVFKLPDNSARFICLTSQSLPAENHTGSEQDWLVADIQAGIPHLLGNVSAEYIPQMLNLQALDAISFTKGCYMGQETVARAKYLGKNKRAGYILQGQLTDKVPQDDTIEMQLGENWRRAGTIANIVSSEQDGTTWVFAVLPNDIENDAVLRFKSMPDSRLSIHSLPYSVE
ncbi:tRNA-modifying protein YgfZ [Planctobacterium marinum]|uniref:tRNA-modifying protein YgfZ n=1 Tax=Planctobacterium marinum TaxID=1631968 RepID=UPI001E6436A7|nr:tRNA-modifying protein YgfZ [Planctobacterium marinum]MCC2604763.1 tRNA-modifying protein YgfZ [Planctobacterium marinum]